MDRTESNRRVENGELIPSSSLADPFCFDPDPFLEIMDSNPDHVLCPTLDRKLFILLLI